MIWKLFRPKPILNISIPGDPKDEELSKKVLGELTKRVEGNYIIILCVSPNITEVKLEIIK